MIAKAVRCLSGRGKRGIFEEHFFIVQPHPYSFDNRYFEPVSDCQIIGVVPPR
jgi:type IV secretory pathway protease TraF